MICHHFTYFNNADLFGAIENSYTPTPVVQEVKRVYDMKSWMMGNIEDIHGHTQPLHFKFTLNEAGKCEMYYRQWCSDSWSQEGLLLVKVQLSL